MDLRQESVAGLAALVRQGGISARELVSHSLARIEELDSRVNAFVAVDAERALSGAAAVDERVARGEETRALAGIPIAVKDLEDASGYVTSRGSAVFSRSAPATADSPLVTRLRAAGCIVVGKTNTPELGWKGDTENTTFGATRNPWSLDHSPGGSSGGSAAAIAAGMVPLATGSDGGGSIRIPSSLCGLSGVKPSLGRVSGGGGAVPDWLDLSTKGPMARRLSDIALALDLVVGPDPTDLRSLPRPEASWQAVLAEPRLPIHVAWSPTLGYAPVDAEVLSICESAVRTMESMGAEVTEVETVFSEDPITPWLTLANACNLRTLEEYRDQPVWKDVDPGLAAQVEWAAEASALDVVRALDACYELNMALVRVFRRARLLVTPTTAGPAPLSGEVGTINGEPDLNWVRFTYPFNLTRSPAATVCAGFTSKGLPVGVQLVGPQHGDLVVLRSAAALEEALGIDTIAPLAWAP